MAQNTLFSCLVLLMLASTAFSRPLIRAFEGNAGRGLAQWAGLPLYDKWGRLLSPQESNKESAFGSYFTREEKFVDPTTIYDKFGLIKDTPAKAERVTDMAAGSLRAGGSMVIDAVPYTVVRPVRVRRVAVPQAAPATATAPAAAAVPAAGGPQPAAGRPQPAAGGPQPAAAASAAPTQG